MLTARVERLCRKGFALSLCAAALLAAALLPSSAEAARVQCPGTFRVLHNDHIGDLSLPKGKYKITILASGRPSCAQAAYLFTRFLQDFDGRLPRPWRLNVASSTFLKRPGVGFHVKRVSGGTGGGGTGGGGGGTHPAGGNFCPATFRVLHNDRIGPLRLPKGRYWIILLSPRNLSCAKASSLFTEFLESFSGKLPPPWRVEAASATFRRGTSAVGFRVKPTSAS